MDPRYLPTDFNGKLAKLSEECHEVGQMAMKAIRFGILNEDPRTGISNLQKIIEEMGDLQHAYLQVFEHVKGEHKKEQIKQFMYSLKPKPETVKFIEYDKNMNHYIKLSKNGYLNIKKDFKEYLRDLNTVIRIDKRFMKSEEYRNLNGAEKQEMILKEILENNIPITYNVFGGILLKSFSEYSRDLQDSFKVLKGFRKALVNCNYDYIIQPAKKGA